MNLTFLRPEASFFLVLDKGTAAVDVFPSTNCSIVREFEIEVPKGF
jgi:hypothetical protein